MGLYNGAGESIVNNFNLLPFFWQHKLLLKEDQKTIIGLVLSELTIYGS